MRYHQIDTTSEIVMENNSIVHPIATLSDGFGMCQIIEDDHCYVLCLQKENGKYAPSPYIFAEAFEVIKTLSTPR